METPPLQFRDPQREHLHDILTWRRDVRHFRKDGIDPAVWSRLEASVDLAPSVGNSRPWRIVRVKSPTVRAAIVRDFESSNRAAAEGYEPEDKAAYLALKLAGLREAPEHLAFFTDLTPAAGRGLGRRTMPETLSYSTVMAIHTFWLTARAYNVGVGWVSILDPDRVVRLLDVPSTWALTAYLCIGYPAHSNETPELHRVGWQDNTATVWIDR